MCQCANDFASGLLVWLPRPPKVDCMHIIISEFLTAHVMIFINMHIGSITGRIAASFPGSLGRRLVRGNVVHHEFLYPA